MEFRHNRSTRHVPFPPSPLQKYLATPRYKPSYRSRSFQYMSKPMHRVTYLNGQRAKVYNSAWLYPEVESPEAKVDLIGKKNRLLLITSKRYGSAHDLSSSSARSPSVPPSPTASLGYHSSLSVPSSPFPSRRFGSEPNRSYSYQELYSPRAPSTPRPEILGSRRTYSASDIMSSSSYYDRHYGYIPYTPPYRRWTSNYDISYMGDHYSSMDALYGYRKAGSCDVLYPSSPSYFDFRPFGSGIFGSEFRSRSGSGSILRSSRPRLDHLGDYHASTRSECDFPVGRYRGPSSKSECGVSPNDVDTRSESGFSLTLSEFDTSFVMGDDETGSINSFDRSFDKLDTGLVPLPDYDHDRFETESVMSNDRTLDVVYEDENSDPDQEADTSSKKTKKPSASVSLLSRFEQSDRQAAGKKPADNNDDDVFRQHTDTLYLYDGQNVQSDDKENPRHKNQPVIKVSQYGDEDETLRQHTDTLYLSDDSNVQTGDVSDPRHRIQMRPSDESDDVVRQHTDTLYLYDGSNVQTGDVSDPSHRTRMRPSDDSDDVVRQHTDTLYLYDGSNVKAEDVSDPSHQTGLKPSGDTDNVIRQHTDTLNIHDASNVQIEDKEKSQHHVPVTNDENDDIVRQHTDTIYLYDGSNVQMEDVSKPKHASSGDGNVAVQDLKKHVTNEPSLQQQTQGHPPYKTEQHVPVADQEDETLRQHTDSLYIYSGANETQDDPSEGPHTGNIPDLAQQSGDRIGHDDRSGLQNVTTNQTCRDSSVSKRIDDDDDDDFREHTETIYISQGADFHIDDSEIPCSSTQENVKLDRDSDSDVRYHTKSEHFEPESRVQNQTDDGDDVRHHIQTIYITEGASTQEDDIEDNTEPSPPAEDVRHHTETLYISDGGHALVKDDPERQHVSSVSTTQDSSQKHEVTVQVSQCADIHENSSDRTDDIEREDENIRHHTETLYIHDGGDVLVNDDPERQDISPVAVRENDMRQHTESKQVSHSANIHQFGSSEPRSELLTGVARSDDIGSEDESIRHHTETIYISDDGNTFLTDDTERQKLSAVAGTQDEMRHQTETVQVSHSGEIHRTDPSKTKSIGGTTGVKNEDEDIRHHTETLYIYDGNNVFLNEDAERQKVSHVPDQADEFKQSTETIYISQIAEIHQNVPSESKSRLSGSSGNTNVQSEAEDVRHHTETIYIHGGDNVLLGEDKEAQEVTIDRPNDDQKQDDTDTFVVIDSDNLVGAEVREDSVSDESSGEDSDEEEVLQHRQIVYISDEANGQGQNSKDTSQHSAKTDTNLKEDLGNVSEESDEEEFNQHRQIVYISDEVDRQGNSGEDSNGVSQHPFETRTDQKDDIAIAEDAEHGSEFLKVVNVDGEDSDDVQTGTRTIFIHDSAIQYESDSERESVEKSGLKNYAQTEQLPDPVDCEDRVDMLTASDEKMDKANSDFEDIDVMEISAIEKSDEFEIIDMPEPVLSSSLVVEISGSRSTQLSHDSSESDNPDNTDTRPIYSHSVSAEYERADHESFEEFVDEREATTSSQVHLAEEDSDSDQFEGQSSDNEISGQSSDEEFDNNSSHRQLTQSGSNSLTNTGEDNGTFSASVDRSVSDFSQDTNPEYAIDRTERVTGAETQDKTLTVDKNLVTKTSTSYSVIHSGLDDGMSVDNENLDVDEIRKGTHKDSDRIFESVTRTDDSNNKSHNIYEDQNKSPSSLTNETPPLVVKSDTSMKSEIDESNSSKADDWQLELAGKKTGDSLGADKTLVRAEDNSLNQNECTSETADQSSSWSVSQADVKMGIDRDRGGESTNSVWKSDNVEEQCTSVKADGKGERSEIQGSEVYDKTIHTTRHDAKVELAKSVQSAHVVAGEERSRGRESIDTLDISQHPGTNTDVGSLGIGNSQELLETENEDFSSSSIEADHSVPVSGLSGSCLKEEAHRENVNRDGRIGVKEEELKKNSGESGVEKVENTNSPSVNPGRKVGESDDIGDDIGDDTRYRCVLNVGEKYTDQHKQFVNGSARSEIHLSSEKLEYNSQPVELNDDVNSSSSDNVNQTGTNTTISSEFATEVKDFSENTGQGTNLNTSKVEFNEDRAQIDKTASNFDDLYQANVDLALTSGTSIPEQRDILNATGGGLNEAAIVGSDNDNMLYIDESHKGDLKAKVVQNTNPGYLHNMADIADMSSAEMHVMDDRYDTLCFTDRTEITLPVEEKTFIKTKVQYTVKKLTKTVTKTDVDVKKVQKNTTGDSVEHERLRKVEQMTVVSQRVWSSTESLDKDEPVEERVKVAYQATFDVTKDKDGRQLPSAHYETAYTGELPVDKSAQALHGESEDILALCNPVSHKATSSKTEYSGSVQGIRIENSPEFQTPEITQTDRETDIQIKIREGDMTVIHHETATGDNVTSVQSSVNIRKSEVLGSDNETRAVVSVDSQSTFSGSSDVLAGDGDYGDIQIPSGSSSDKKIVVTDVTLTSDSTHICETVSPEIPNSENESLVYTERIETFSSPITMSPVTVKRRRWSTERKFTDDKLICTLYEDTVTEGIPERRDDALYILEDNIHVTDKATDRAENFVTLPSKTSFKMKEPVKKPIWTYNLASLTAVDYSNTECLGETGDSEPGRVVPPDSPSDNQDLQLSSVKEIQISENKPETVEVQNLSSAEVQDINAVLANTLSEMETNLNSSRTVSHVTFTSISHTSEMYEDDFPMNETEDKQTLPSENRVRSLPSASSSKQDVIENGDARSWTGSSDTTDVARVSEFPEQHDTSFEETDPYVDDTDNSSLFLGGGLNERAADTSGQEKVLAANKESQIQLTKAGTENQQYSLTENSDLIKMRITENEETSQVTDTYIHDEREKGQFSTDTNFWTDSNSNILQVKEAGTLSLKQGLSDQCDLSQQSQTMVKYREAEDRSSVFNQEEICETVTDEKTELSPWVESSSSVRETAPGSYGNKSCGLTEGQADLSSGVETNRDSLPRETDSVFLTTSHSVSTHHPTQTSQISTYTTGCDTGSDNDGNIFTRNESDVGLSTVDEKPSCSGETEDIQPDYRAASVLSGSDVSGVQLGHAVTTTDQQQRVFTSSLEENAQLYGSGTAYSAIETGDSIDGQQTILTALHSVVDSASTSDGLAYSGQTEVGKLNAETNRQNAISLQSVTADDGMLINSQNLVEQHAEDEKYANVTRAVGGNEFTSEGNVSIVSELETFGGSGGRGGLNIESEVTVTGELDITVVHSTASDDESPDYDRESRIKEFSEAFRRYSIEELPVQQSRRNDQSISESRGRLTSVNDVEIEETEYSSKMSHFDYDDWTQSEAAREQLHFNRSAEDGMKLHDEISQYSDSSFVRMDDISSSDEVNRSMGSDQLDRLDWLESQVHTDDSGLWQGSSFNRSVLVTGQVEYDSNMEENNNYVKEIETSYADDSDNSDMDTSESQYSTTMTCEFKDGQTQRTISPSSLDERFSSVSEHMFGEFKPDPHDGKSRLLSSTSSDGYFSSASELMTGELRLSATSDTFRHVSSTSSEGYHSYISDQMTGELKLSPSDDSQKSDERRELEIIENDLKEKIREFESWSEQLSDASQESEKTQPKASDQKTGLLSMTDQTQTKGHVGSTVSGQIQGQIRYHDQTLTEKGGLSSDQSRLVLTQGTSTVTVGNRSDDIGVDELDQLSLTQKYTSSDYQTHHLKHGGTEVTTHKLGMAGAGMYAQMTPQEETLQQKFSSSDLRSSEMRGQSKTLTSSSVVTGLKTVQIQHGGMISGSSASEEGRQKTQISSSSLSTSDRTVRQMVTGDRTVRQMVTSSQEQETYENVPESISEKVKDELLQKSYGYFSSSVSVNLSKQWKLFEKLWHSFDGFSWKGNLALHLFTFVFQKAVENQMDTVDQFEKLYPLLLIEDVERCQNHICMALYTDEYLKQRKMQKYFLRGFTKDLKSLWHTKRKQSLVPLCDIPEERIVSFTDCASVTLPTCHTTSIHPSVVSFAPVSKYQFSRFSQEGDSASVDSGADVQKGDDSFDSGEDNSTDSLQYICQGDLTDPTIMLSRRLRDLRKGDDTEILDDVLLRGLRHYRSKFMRFNPYVQVDVRKSVVRKQTLRNETIYEEEEDERFMN